MLKVSKHLNTVPVGKVIVQHQQVESARGENLECNVAVHRHSSLIALVLECLLQCHENILIIVRNQNLAALALFHCGSSQFVLGCDNGTQLEKAGPWGCWIAVSTAFGRGRKVEVQKTHPGFLVVHDRVYCVVE